MSIRRFSFILLAFIAFAAHAVARELPREFLNPRTALKTVDGFTYIEQYGQVYSIPLAPSPDSTVSLAGAWLKKRMDMDHFASISPRGAETMRILEAEGGNAVDADTSGWNETQIPSVENMSPDDKYQGGAWYRRSIAVPASFAGKRVRIVFFAANYVTDVWVNGKWAGAHEGGFTSFAFDVTKLITPGADNLIAVRVDNIPWWKETEGYKNGDTTANPATYITPYKPCDWWNYSGIYRDVFLYADGESRIEDTSVNASPAPGGGSLRARVLLNGIPDGGSLRVEILNTDINEKNITDYDPRAIIGAPLHSYTVDIHAGASGLRGVDASGDVPGAKPWTPESPSLYVLRLTLLDKSGARLDERVMQLGFRDVAISQKPPAFTLNGAQYMLFGVNRHDEIPGRGRAMDMMSIRPVYEDFARIKSLGANFVRLAHYPNHPASFMLADRLGLLVAEEIPVYWFEEDGFAIQNTRGVATAMMLEMVARDRNFTSGAYWSMGNETVGMSEGKKFFDNTYKLAKQLDPSRPTTHILSYKTPWDPSVATGDFIAMNCYFGVFDKLDYAKDTARFIKVLAKRYPRKPLLVTEFGIGASRDKPESREKQKRVFAETYGAARPIKSVMGFAWWAMYQYKGIGGWDSWGLCSFDRTYCNEPAFEEMKKTYTAR